MTNKEAIEVINANYPPENYTLLREALDMAIILLKRQEPQVLTLEELLDKRQFPNNTRPIWIECKNGNVDAFVLIYTEYIGDDNTVTTIGQGTYVQETWRQGDYEKEWRAWNILPSKEQQENVKWE